MKASEFYNKNAVEIAINNAVAIMSKTSKIENSLIKHNFISLFEDKNSITKHDPVFPSQFESIEVEDALV